MSIPAQPSNFVLQTGNESNYVSWNLTTGATSYVVKRSTDQITYSTVSSPTATEYQDTSVTLGTTYWYKVAAVNSDGTSSYTTPQSIVPTHNGEMSLGFLRLCAQQRADRVNSNFLTKAEWNTNINNSMLELYDLLVGAYEDYFSATPVTFTTDGTNYQYALPNGTNYTAAKAFYKLMGVDLAVNSIQNAWVTVPKYNFIDRNNYLYPNSNSTLYGVVNTRYRMVGTNIQFIPIPASGQTIRLWYVPRLDQLLKDNDVTTIGHSGWLEYVIVDAAIKALQKEESDVSVLMARKQELKDRIEAIAQNRDQGEPDTISDTRQDGSEFGSFGQYRGGF